MIRFAERMTRLGTEGAFEVLAKARRLEAEGKQIVHLEIGEPDFATPDNIVESGISAMQNGYTHYTPASGIFEAREAVAQFVTQMLKTDVDPNDDMTMWTIQEFCNGTNTYGVRAVQLIAPPPAAVKRIRGNRLYSGLVDRGTHAVAVVEKLTGRSIGSLGREIIAVTLDDHIHR